MVEKHDFLQKRKKMLGVIGTLPTDTGPILSTDYSLRKCFFPAYDIALWPNFADTIW